MRGYKQHLLLFIAILVSQSLTSFKSSTSQVDEPVLFKPLTFYIAETRDLRSAKVTESGGLNKFIADNLPKNQALKPVVIDIKELSVIETPGKTGLVNGEIKMSLAFNLQKQDITQHLLNYNGGLRYSRLATNKGSLEQNLKKLNQSALLYFNKWMNANININKVLASGVKLRFEYYKDQLEGDTIYYAASRPLTWRDFKGKRRLSTNYAAMVMPNIGYNQEEDIKDGIIQVTLTLQTFLAKNDCVLAASYKDDYMLNHEQRHFDVAKIVTEQFKRKLQQANLTPDNYEAVINMQYLDSYRDMNKLQKDYDKETAHGLNKSSQEKWNQQIDNLLTPFSTSLQPQNILAIPQ
jgi:hypothetical protein